MVSGILSLGNRNPQVAHRHIQEELSMTNHDLTELRASLVERLGKLRRSLNADLEGLCDNNSVMSDDISDAAKDSEDDELNSRLAEVGSREIQAVLKAIERVDAGDYGICEDCEKKIAMARLEALPYAVRCVTCQGEYERTCENAERDIFVDDED